MVQTAIPRGPRPRASARSNRSQVAEGGAGRGARWVPAATARGQPGSARGARAGPPREVWLKWGRPHFGGPVSGGRGESLAPRRGQEGARGGSGAGARTRELCEPGVGASPGDLRGAGRAWRRAAFPGRALPWPQGCSRGVPGSVWARPSPHRPRGFCARPAAWSGPSGDLVCAPSSGRLMGEGEVRAAADSRRRWGERGREPVNKCGVYRAPARRARVAGGAWGRGGPRSLGGRGWGASALLPLCLWPGRGRGSDSADD
jgi:hypothetical protein